MFKCNKCGECCRHLNMSRLYDELNDGTGKCKYLSGNLCSIYDNRPLLCRVDECYDLFFSDKMTREEYYELNYIWCGRLREEE